MIEKQIKKVEEINKLSKQIALREYKLKIINKSLFLGSQISAKHFINFLTERDINKPFAKEYLKLSYLILEGCLKNKGIDEDKMWKCIKMRHFRHEEISYQTLEEKIDLIYKISKKMNCSFYNFIISIFTHLIWFSDFNIMYGDIAIKIFREHQVKTINLFSQLWDIINEKKNKNGIN